MDLTETTASGTAMSPALTRDPMTPRFLVVRRVTRETADTVTLELEDPSGAGFDPGQFNMLYLFGAGEVAISLSGDPADRQNVVHTIRAVGSVTMPLASLRRGAMVGVRGPFGRGWPLAEAARRGCDLILLAGGIGLAPLRPVIHAVHRDRDRFGRLTLLYGARRPADLLFAKELTDWNRPRTHVRTIVDRGDLGWSGRVGVLTDLLAEINFDLAETIALICGPEVMMRFAQRELVRRGMEPRDIYLSLERNMKCAVGFCGHCMMAGSFVCKDGPVFCLSDIAAFFGVREL